MSSVKAGIVAAVSSLIISSLGVYVLNTSNVYNHVNSDRDSLIKSNKPINVESYRKEAEEGENTVSDDTVEHRDDKTSVLVNSPCP